MTVEPYSGGAWTLLVLALLIFGGIMAALYLAERAREEEERKRHG